MGARLDIEVSKQYASDRGVVAGAGFLPSDLAWIARYFIGEKSVGRMYVTSAFSRVFSACSDLITV